MKVAVELDELAELHTTAKLSAYRQAELERVKKEDHIRNFKAEAADIFAKHVAILLEKAPPCVEADMIRLDLTTYCRKTEQKGSVTA